MEAFVDTWAWLALGHQKDPYHVQVFECFQSLLKKNVTLVTSDYVLNERITMLFRRERYEDATLFIRTIFRSSEEGNLALLRVTGQRFSRAWELREKYQDKPLISFTDLTSMAIMEELEIHCVVTDDDHFEHVGMGFEKIP